MIKRLILAIAAAFCALSAPNAYAACSPYTYTFSNGTTADATQVNSNFTTVMNCATTPAPISTRQILTSGTSATYTTPANARQLRIRMVGGGGGGMDPLPSPGTQGTNGGTTSFDSVTVIGGHAGNAYSASAGGSGGSNGGYTNVVRISGGQGAGGEFFWATAGQMTSPSGGSSPFGGAGGGTVQAAGGAAAANSGSGGGGGATNSGCAASSGPCTGGGGASGEYVEFYINAPSSSYTYTVGSGGTAGNYGSGTAGGAGGSGIIIVDEYY